MSWFRKICLTLAIVILILLIILIIWARGETRLASLPCGIERRIEVYADNVGWNDLSYIGVRWQVYENGVAKLRDGDVPGRYGIGFLNENANANNLRFSLIFSGDRSIVGLIEDHEPNNVLAIVDFSRHIAWPYDWSTSANENVKQAEELLPHLRRAVLNPELKLNPSLFVGGIQVNPSR